MAIFDFGFLGFSISDLVVIQVESPLCFGKCNKMDWEDLEMHYQEIHVKLLQDLLTTVN